MADACKKSSMMAWMNLVRVYERMQRHTALHMGHFDLTPAQYDVLAQLSDAPGISQQDLAARLMVTKGNVCGLIDRLSARGYVERREDPEDRRSNLLYLTEVGQRLAEEAIPAYGDFVSDHMSSLTEIEQHALEDLLVKLDRSLEDH
jgi:DNA-binding MarR family transcriptional regulator